MKRQNRIGFSLLSSVVLVLFLSIVASAAFMRTQIQLGYNNQRLLSQQAFNAAEAGVQRAIYELRRNSKWRSGMEGQPDFIDVPLSYGDNPPVVLGYYTIEAKSAAQDYNSFPSVWVKATGKDSSQKIVRSILARIIVDSPTKFFLSSSGDIRIGSGSTFDSDLLGKDIYFDVNDSLTGDQKNININGKIFYLSKIYGDDNPAVKMGSKSGKIHFPSITFTGIDLDRYRTIAKQSDGRYINGNFTYNDNIGLEELSALNGVVFVEGDLTIAGNIKDSMLFVASGNIYINKSILSSDSTNSSQLGLLAKKNVFITENAPSDIEINAFIMADGGEVPSDEEYHGGIFQALGDKFSKGKLTFNGAMALRASYERTAADLNVYQTRDYKYNTQLRDNPQIPLLPSFANIVHWQEINPSEPIPE